MSLRDFQAIAREIKKARIKSRDSPKKSLKTPAKTTVFSAPLSRRSSREKLSSGHSSRWLLRSKDADPHKEKAQVIFNECKNALDAGHGLRT